MTGFTPRLAFIHTRRRKSHRSTWKNWRGWLSIRKSSRGEKSDSTITTIIRRAKRKRVFSATRWLSRRAKKPIIIHCRDAWTDCLNMIEEHWRPTGLGGILHCFTGTLDDARRGMDMGFLISFAGNSTYPKTQNLRDVAKALPLEKILIETDAPYLAPQPYRGKRNEPAYVAEVARTLATVRDLTPEEIAAATTGNFRRFFGLAKPASLAASGLKADE